MRPKIVMFALFGLLAAGCPNSGGSAAGTGAKASTSSTSTGKVTPTTLTGATSVAATNPNDDPQCAVFKNTAKDLTACVGCKQTLCPCTTPDHTQQSGCAIGGTDISGCTVDINQLVQCVHNNLAAAGGPCVGLKCGDGQIADFNACLCRDALPTVSFGPAPGQDDTGTPYLEPGFFVSDRFCSSNPTTGGSPGECLLDKANGSTSLPLNPGTPPQYAQQAPANVFADVGYLRWDLGLDASQYSPALPIAEKKPFMGTWATFPVTLSMYYQLKPNTQISSTSVRITDCAEHFSGFAFTGATSSLTSDTDCDITRSEKYGARAPLSVPLQQSGATGTAQVPNISINGTSANKNILAYRATGALPAFGVEDVPATPGEQLFSGPNGPGFGLAKEISGSAPLAGGVGCVGPANCLSGTGTSDNLSTDTSLSRGTAMLSNIGYYKYTWGPFNVQRPPSLSGAVGTTAGGGTVSGRIAVNTNLGYNPVSAVESTALSSDALSGSVQTRDCTVATVPYACVITSTYRAPGGGVLSQSFSPVFTNTHSASTVMALPEGVTAVSTPKTIEDISQLDVTTGRIHTPARLRTFVRASDGNIYMSRFDNAQWHPWLSLGRPWMTDPTTALNILTNPATTSVASPYLPIIGLKDTSFPDPPALNPFTASAFSLLNGAYTGKSNDGISIAGEPVVASFMDQNKVYANMGGVSSGAPLDIATIGIEAPLTPTKPPAGLLYTAPAAPLAVCPFSLATTCLRVNFGSTVGEDPVALTSLTVGQSVYLNGFVLSTNLGVSINTTITGAGAQQFIVASINPPMWGTGVIGDRFTRTPVLGQSPTVPGNILLSGIPGTVALLQGSGLTSFAKITQYPDFMPNYGLIGVFVRVSQLNSSDGLPGKWHNSVWYTMSKSLNQSIITGKPLTFDDPKNWTSWMLVQEGANDLSFRIQGNPAVIVRARAPNVHAPLSPLPGAVPEIADFHIFGTSSFAVGGQLMLHPPVGPTGTTFIHSVSAPVFPRNQSVAGTFPRNDAFNLHRNWFNYGLDLLQTSIDVKLIDTSNWNATSPAVLGGFYPITGTYPNGLGAFGIPWRTPSKSTLPAAQHSGVLGDWTYAPVSGLADTIRLFSTEIDDMRNPCFEVEGVSANGDYNPTGGTGNQNTLVAPCLYKKKVIWQEYALNQATAAADDFRCMGAYSGAPKVFANESPPPSNVVRRQPYTVGFVGSLHAINININSASTKSTAPNPDAADPVGKTLVSTSYTPAAKTAGHMLLFGRATCPDKGRCDDVNPSVAYMAVSEVSECVAPIGNVPVVGNFPLPDNIHYEDPANTFHVMPQNVMYYGGQQYSWNRVIGIPNSADGDFTGEIALQSTTNTSLLTPFTATADVIPIFSNALKLQNNDVSLFFFTRDVTGNIAHGYWEGQTDPVSKQITGSRDFTIFSSGAFTN